MGIRAFAFTRCLSSHCCSGFGKGILGVMPLGSLLLVLVLVWLLLVGTVAMLKTGAGEWLCLLGQRGAVWHP